MYHFTTRKTSATKLIPPQQQRFHQQLQQQEKKNQAEPETARHTLYITLNCIVCRYALMLPRRENPCLLSFFFVTYNLLCINNIVVPFPTQETRDEQNPNETLDQRNSV